MSVLFRIRFWVGFLAAYAGTAVAGAPLYRAIEIAGVPGYEEYRPVDLNDNGVVVGEAQPPAGPPVSFVWTKADGIRTASKSVTAINAKGTGVVAELDAAGVDVFTIDRDRSENFFLDGSWAHDGFESAVQITDSGYILGSSRTLRFPGSTMTSAWVWSPVSGLSRILPDTPSHFIARRMNERGQIVGDYYKDCTERAFVYDLHKKLLTSLGPGTGPRSRKEDCGLSSAAYGINNGGQLVGVSNSEENYDAFQMFLWSKGAGYEVIPSGDDPRNYDMTPSFINDTEQVVGHFMTEQTQRTGMFYWDRQNGWFNLQDLLDPADPLSSKIVIEGNSSIPTIPKINNRGEILVSGAYKPDDFRAMPDRTFLLVPSGR